MKIRADIAALLREGHTVDSIAVRVGCHPSTVANARRVLRMPERERMGRLYAEAIPTGRVGEYRPPNGWMPLSPAQQADNRARLLAALREPAA